MVKFVLRMLMRMYGYLILLPKHWFVHMTQCTVGPRSSDLFNIVNYYKKMGSLLTGHTVSSVHFLMNKDKLSMEAKLRK